MATARQVSGATRGRIAAAFTAVALVATTAEAPPRPDPPVLTQPGRAPATRHLWSAAQVHELIALVEESRGQGLDPADYGLAALRAELEQSTTLYRSSGSRQLDALACASAVALARAYRRHRVADGLALALRTNRLRDWIGAPGAKPVSERS